MRQEEKIKVKSNIFDLKLLYNIGTKDYIYYVNSRLLYTDTFIIEGVYKTLLTIRIKNQIFILQVT